MMLIDIVSNWWYRSSTKVLDFVEREFDGTVRLYLSNKFTKSTCSRVVYCVGGYGDGRWFVDAVYLVKVDGMLVAAYFARLTGQRLLILDISDKYSESLLDSICVHQGDVMIDLLSDQYGISMYMNTKLPSQIY